MAEHEGLVPALRDLAGAFKPLWVGQLESEISSRLDRVPTELNEYGYDAWGMNPDWMRRAAIPSALLYRYYFRAETRGIENVPDGPVLLVANHAGQLPFDGVMLGMAMLLDAEPPRVARGMAEYWVSDLPFVSVAAARTGAAVGTPTNCLSLLRAGECVMVFPEGVEGISKPYRNRYQLQAFGLGFMRLALESGAPIVPVSIVGSEEQQPGFANLRKLGRALGMPAFPITLGFPWLGPLGLLPLPVKYRIYFGEPLAFTGDAGDDDRHMQQKVDQVKAAIAAGLEAGLRERQGIFSG